MADLQSLPIESNQYDQAPGTLELGAFSISLAVKDLQKSRSFYEKLGFEVTGGAVDQNYLILVNGETVLGLFQGMFEKNMLTFNPGLSNRMKRLDRFKDIREVQQRIKESGLDLETQADQDGTGPASLTLIDPDGNPVLIDQFFPKA